MTERERRSEEGACLYGYTIVIEKAFIGGSPICYWVWSYSIVDDNEQYVDLSLLSDCKGLEVEAMRLLRAHVEGDPLADDKGRIECTDTP